MPHTGEVCTQVHSINIESRLKNYPIFTECEWFHQKKEPSLSFESHRCAKKCQADKDLILPVTAASVHDVIAEMLSKCALLILAAMPRAQDDPDILRQALENESLKTPH